MYGHAGIVILYICCVHFGMTDFLQGPCFILVNRIAPFRPLIDSSSAFFLSSVETKNIRTNMVDMDISLLNEI